MKRCIKILLLLVYREVAEVKENRLKVKEYEDMINCHVKICPDCRRFLEKMRKKQSGVDFGE